MYFIFRLSVLGPVVTRTSPDVMWIPKKTPVHVNVKQP